MKYPAREYPLFSACGLNCGLCPRCYTNGISKCPCCGSEEWCAKGYPCGWLSSRRSKGFEYCFQCAEYPCKRFDGADLTDPYITRKNQSLDLEKAKRNGTENYKAELSEKINVLDDLLKGYDDGRRKTLFCTVVNLLDLKDVRSVMGQIGNEVLPDAPLKEKSAAAVRLFEDMAGKRGISLKLRRKAENKS